MAEEFQTGICGGNWWSSPKSVFIGGLSPCSAGNIADFGTYGSWMTTDMVDLKARSCKEQSAVFSDGCNIIFQDSQRPQQTDSDSRGSSILMDSTFPVMGFGISSPSSSSAWNHTLLSRTMLQEDMNSGINSSQIQKDWSPKSFTSTGDDSSVDGFKGMSQDFSLDQQRINPVNSCSGNSTATCQGLSTGFSMGSASYGYPPTAAQTLFERDLQPQQSLFDNYSSSTPNYGNNNLNDIAASSWPSLPKEQHSGLHFSNNTPFWNASAAALNDIRTSFLPSSSSQSQFIARTFEEKPTFPSQLNAKIVNNEEIRDSGSATKKGSEPAFKRPRIQTPSPLPTFKVRKEKLGDRITALQQLVSPFGKTDTASVLHEAIEYIKYLHEQVFSNPYMKNGNTIQHQQVQDPERAKQLDLRSRGLCLVPISSTFPVATETTADFWTPTFGVTFR